MARWYDPALGRFVQADTVVPDGVQGLDRYAYVSNNPVKYNDPSGHSPCDDWGACEESDSTSTTTTTSSTNTGRNYPVNAPSKYFCSSTLQNCFGDEVKLKNLFEYNEDNPIPIEEFETLADKVAEDLFTHDLGWPGYFAGRGTYDTPFYNGGESEQRTGIPGSENGYWAADQRVCIETLGCSGRSEINYFAQGMWGAAVGEPKPVSVFIVFTWKVFEYHQNPSEKTLFWLNYGYDYYQEWLNNSTK